MNDTDSKGQKIFNNGSSVAPQYCLLYVYVRSPGSGWSHVVCDRPMAHTPAPRQDLREQHQEGTAQLPGTRQGQGQQHTFILFFLCKYMAVAKQLVLYTYQVEFFPPND